ncbi:MAG: hypothetical protein EOO57_04900 [Hymenobacter sp.]|nr:MAG: hypothetical protein EOO57_04900 [Hymenobacter sp.]
MVSANRYLLISAGTASVRSLTLNPGATLTQGGGTLLLRGDLPNNGTFTATAGTVATSAGTSKRWAAAAHWPSRASTSARPVPRWPPVPASSALTLTGNFSINGQPLTLLFRVLNTSGTNVAQDGLVVNSEKSLVVHATGLFCALARGRMPLCW